MEKFNLEEYKKNPNRKVVTRRGNPVRIICTDRKHGEDDLPIVFLEEFSNGGEFLSTCKSDGTANYHYATMYDLFFADEDDGKLNSIIDELKSYLEKTPKEQVEKDWREIQDWYTKHFTNEKHNKEEKLTEFEKELQIIISDASHWTSDDGSISTYCQFGDKEIKKISGKLLDLARKEIEKENPYSGNQNQEWSKEEEERLITDYLKFKGYEDDSIWLKSFKGRVKPKQEWSEKDEHCIELLLPIIDSSSLIPKNRKKCKEFLKSLKDRVQPQPEQKWSEEDEKISNAIYESIDFLCLKSFGFSEDEVCDWLKSLKPHWKPSED